MRIIICLTFILLAICTQSCKTSYSNLSGTESLGLSCNDSTILDIISNSTRLILYTTESYGNHCQDSYFIIAQRKNKYQKIFYRKKSYRRYNENKDLYDYKEERINKKFGDSIFLLFNKIDTFRMCEDEKWPLDYCKGSHPLKMLILVKINKQIITKGYFNIYECNEEKFSSCRELFIKMRELIIQNTGNLNSSN